MRRTGSSHLASCMIEGGLWVEGGRRCFEGAGKRVIDVSENSDNGVVTAREGDQCAAEAYVKMLSGDGKQKKKMYYL